MSVTSKNKLPSGDAYDVRDATIRERFENLNGIHIVVSTESENSSEWTGNAKFESLKTGDTILFYFSSPSQGVATLDLTFSNGMNTGQINVYSDMSTRFQDDVAEGTFLMLTFFKRREIEYSGALIDESMWVVSSGSAGTNFVKGINVNDVPSEMSNGTISISIPTNNNQLSNGAGYQTASDVATAIQTALAAITNANTTQY